MSNLFLSRYLVMEEPLFHGYVTKVDGASFFVNLTGQFGSDFDEHTSSVMHLERDESFDIQEGDFIHVKIRVFREINSASRR